MQSNTSSRHDSLLELISLEKSNLSSLLLQQAVEFKLPSGRPQDLEPDIRTCEMMISIWTERVQREHWSAAP